MVYGGMETGRKTRPGILTWTPAPPAQNSSTDASSSEDEDDFFTRMDENGIIGLSDLEEPGHREHEPPESPEPVGPEEADLVRCLIEKPAEDLKKPAREYRGAPLTRRDTKNELKVDEMVKLLPGHSTEEAEKHELIRSSGLPPRRKSPAEVSDCLRPLSQSSILPHLSHFTAEELAAAPGIDAETLPDVSESLLDSHSSTKSSPRRPQIQPETSFYQQIAPKLHKSVNNSPTGGAEHHEEPQPSPRRTRKLKPVAATSRTFTGGEKVDSSKQNKSQRGSRIPRFRKDATEGEEFRKGMLSHQTQNFSKVEPRVYFPKGGYKPPRSKQSLTRMSPEVPIAFKSPADIVKEVLFDSDGSSTPSESPPNAATFTVPPEFRCRQQASTLLQQLQDDYNRLLTKYAEAENTIDRLRLEAKDRIIEKQQLRLWRFQPIRDQDVNLNFDPPGAGPSVLHPGLNQNKLLKLDFCAAQRAEVTSGRPSPNGSPQGKASDSPHVTETPALGQQLSGLLFSRTERFLQQLQTFEDLIKSENLSACEKMEGVSRLSEGLNSLERSYLLTRDEHKLLQQRGLETCGFDPERELEGLIFECGLRMEELKEQQTPPRSSSTSEEEQTLTPPQSLPESPEDPADPQTSSASKKSDGETPVSTLCRPQISKHTCVESTKTGNLDQTLKNLPERLRVPSSPDLKTSAEPGSEEEEEETSHRTGTDDVMKEVESDLDSPVSSRNQRTCSRVGPSSVPPAPPARGRRRLEMRRSHSSSLSSLAETTSDRRSSKTQTGSRRVQSQDGIVSPETDSGFVGSESSRLTPAAAPGLLHQRATERVSAPRPVSPPPSPSPGPTAQETPVSPRLDPNQPRRTRPGQGRRALSCSPQPCVSQRWQTREPRAETPFGSDAEQSDPYSGSINSPLSSSPAAGCLRGDSPRAASFSRGGNHNDAVATLQVEVTRLKEKIENYMRTKKRLGSEAQRSSTFTPPIRFEGVWSDDSLGRRETGEVDEVELESEFRRTERSTSAPNQKQVSRSELDLQPHVSRWTQTSAEPHSCSSRKTQTSDEPEPDGRNLGRLCPQCRSNIRERPEQPPGGSRELARSCSLCGGLKTHKRSETDRSKQNPPSHQNRRAAEPPDRSANWRYFTAAAEPSVIRFLYPPQLLLCSTPLYSSPDDITGVPSGVRRPEERTGRTGRSLSVDVRRSLDGSLNRAIRAARHMKHTSGHMARSLASGLRDRDRVTQSCSY